MTSTLGMAAIFIEGIGMEIILLNLTVFNVILTVERG